ncbi:hypothetical protein [Halobacillus campisalis]|uniref:TetR family transcriptional regulator n=1 Tax=Halobacillus campisalis TaxID=435909 RepID=A0ABW2JYV5_9BACI|nr:hypothetical protein [Halobacillus campisalis]
MNQNISHEEMDSILANLEGEYIRALNGNDSTNIEEFVEQFLYDSWDYNDRNIESIQKVMSRYSGGEIHANTFAGSFQKMVDHLQKKLASLDEDDQYPMVHSPLGASILVAFVDGLVIQYYTAVYTVDDLKEATPHFKQIILNALRMER